MDNVVKLFMKIGFLIFISYYTSGTTYNDLVFAIERSSNVSTDNYMRTIDTIYNMTELFTIGNEATLVSLVTFSASVRVEFAFSDCKNPLSLQTAITNLRRVQPEGHTNIQLTLNVINHYVLLEQNGARPNANKTIVIFSTSLKDTKSILKDVKGSMAKTNVIFIRTDPLLRRSYISNTDRPVFEFKDNTDTGLASLDELASLILSSSDKRLYVKKEKQNDTEDSWHDLSSVPNNNSKQRDIYTGSEDDVLVILFIVIGTVTVCVIIYILTKMFCKPHILSCSYYTKYLPICMEYHQPTDIEQSHKYKF